MSRGAGDRFVTFRGDWNAELTYNPRELVRYDGSVWLAVSRSLGEVPSEGSPAWLGFGGGGGDVLLLADVPPPGVDYDASRVGVSPDAAREDHTHQSVQFAYDFVVVS